jgi:glutamate--cysteine ligase
MGIKNAAGNWQQLNTNVLQIENEYYSNIRPKRVTATGERPLQALRARGIQYIEVRCLDINPFLPLGIDASEAHFLDAFLLFSALNDSPCLADGECGVATDNFLKVVKEGRRPGLELQRCGENVLLSDWAGQLLDEIAQVAALLDRSHGDARHATALAEQRAKIADSSLTPSARVLDELRRNGESFSQFALRQTRAHADYFRSRAPSAAELAQFEAAARQSLERQAAMEAADELDFDSFVAEYQRSLSR